MFLKQLNLLNFKNYSEASISFHDGVNCITGLNGSGKTNILDAVHYLSMCKSYFTSGDVQSIKHGENFTVISGLFEHGNKTDEVYCTIRKDQKKIFKCNNDEYERLSDHIGLFPLIMIAPQDHDLISEGSEVRRKFIDGIISQIDHDYLKQLISYNRVLVQRNSLLKQLTLTQTPDYSLFEFFDYKLNEAGTEINGKRQAFFEKFKQDFVKSLLYMTGRNEVPEIEYQSQLNENNLGRLLKENFRKDIDMQFTTSGIHKDDVLFKIDARPVKKFASQGQQKTFVIALKLAQYEFMRQKKNLKPLVLLDDIYDKLDDVRIGKLMQMVNQHEFGQLIITDTNADRIRSVFKNMNADVNLLEVNSGQLTQ